MTSKLSSKCSRTENEYKTATRDDRVAVCKKELFKYFAITESGAYFFPQFVISVMNGIISYGGELSEIDLSVFAQYAFIGIYIDDLSSKKAAFFVVTFESTL